MASLETGDNEWTWPVAGAAVQAPGTAATLPARGPATVPVPVSLDSIGSVAAAALIEGERWWSPTVTPDGRMVLTYSFANAQSGFAPAYGPHGFTASVSAFSAADRAVVREALARIEAVCAIRFVEVADSGGTRGTLRYGYSEGPNDLGFAGYSFFPSDAAQAGDIWIGREQAGADWDFYRPNLLLHETLHALGLKHPFEGPTVMRESDDVIANTVMSYSPLPGYSAGSLSAYPAEPMVADIDALQALYGSAPHNLGDTVYRLSAPEWAGGFRVIWDSAGVDVLDAGGLAGAVVIDLAAGARSDIGQQVFALGQASNGAAVAGSYRETLAIASGARIEHAIGTSQGDLLRGNALDNMLLGGAGDDRVLGVAGDDWLVGGAGSDLLVGGTGVDTVVFSGAISNYQVALQDGRVTVRDLRTGDVDVLEGIEGAMFADRVIGIATEVPAALAGLLV